MDRKFFNCLGCSAVYYVETPDESYDLDSYYCPFCGTDNEEIEFVNKEDEEDDKKGWN